MFLMYVLIFAIAICFFVFLCFVFGLQFALSFLVVRFALGYYLQFAFAIFCFSFLVVWPDQEARRTARSAIRITSKVISETSYCLIKL